jgi:hypothetical protein
MALKSLLFSFALLIITLSLSYSDTKTFAWRLVINILVLRFWLRRWANSTQFSVQFVTKTLPRPNYSLTNNCP